MATKTITIDIEESFRQIIKRVVRPPLDVERFLARLESLSMSPKATTAIEAHLRPRPSRRVR